MNKDLPYDLNRTHFMLKAIACFDKLWSLNKHNTVRNYSRDHFLFNFFYRESQGYAGICEKRV